MIKPARFELLRYFSIASLVAIVMGAILSAMFHRQLALKDLTELGEKENVALTQAFANSIWPQFAPFLTSTVAVSPDQLRSHPETARIRQAIIAQMSGLSVVRVKIYNLTGLTVFSTEPSQIGEDKSSNTGFLAARSGEPASTITHRHQMDSFEGIIEDRNILSTYVPIRRGGSGGPIEGVFELYSDVTPLLDRIKDTRLKVIIGSVLIFASLYLVLFFIVRRADGIIRRQEDERRQMEEELRESEKRLRQIADNIGDMIWMAAPDQNRIVYVSPMYKTIWGRTCESLYEQPTSWFEAVHPEDRDHVMTSFQERPSQEICEVEYRIVRPDGSVRWIWDRSFPIRNQFGEVYRVAGTTRDITERKQAEEALRKAHDELEMRVHERTAELQRANEDLRTGILERKVIEDTLRESQAQLAGIIGLAMDGIITIDEDQRVVLFNRAAERIFRCSAAEVMGQSIDRFIPERFHSSHREHVRRFGEAKQGSRHLLSGGRIFFGLRADGEEFPVDISISQVEIAGRKLYTAILRDATQRMQAEQELRSSHEQLRALGAHMESAREEERGRVAREVHDELGQALTALKFDLSWLANRLAGDNPGLLAETRAMIKLVDSTIERVRRISTELRPGILDDLGLVAALEWQAQDFETRTGNACDFSSSVAETGLNREVATALFRICQEALTNVIRHAEASRVEILLEEESAHLVLAVRDNGKGIRAEEIAIGKSMGILGMRERAQLLGGRVSIVGRPGEGTRVTVAIPLERARGLMA